MDSLYTEQQEIIHDFENLGAVYTLNQMCLQYASSLYPTSS